jgi:hypothetical protein
LSITTNILKGQYSQEQIHELISYNEDLIEYLESIIKDNSLVHKHWEANEEKRLAKQRLIAYRKLVRPNSTNMPEEPSAPVAAAAAAVAPVKTLSAAQESFLKSMKYLTKPPQKGKGRKTRKSKSNKKSSRKSKR